MEVAGSSGETTFLPSSLVSRLLCRQGCSSGTQRPSHTHLKPAQPSGWHTGIVGFKYMQSLKVRSLIRNHYTFHQIQLNYSQVSLSVQCELIKKTRFFFFF